MNAATARALHQARCRDPYCESCPTAAESRKEAAEEPYDDQGGRADTYERSLGL